MTFAEKIDLVWTEVVRPVLLARQGEYGPTNLLRHGHTGLYVRMDDKTARLAHYTAQLRLAPGDLAYQEVYRDLAGYAVMGELLRRGWLTDDAVAPYTEGKTQMDGAFYPWAGEPERPRTPDFPPDMAKASAPSAPYPQKANSPSA